MRSPLIGLRQRPLGSLILLMTTFQFRRDCRACRGSQAAAWAAILKTESRSNRIAIVTQSTLIRVRVTAKNAFGLKEARQVFPQFDSVPFVGHVLNALDCSVPHAVAQRTNKLFLVGACHLANLSVRRDCRACRGPNHGMSCNQIRSATERMPANSSAASVVMTIGHGVSGRALNLKGTALRPAFHSTD